MNQEKEPKIIPVLLYKCLLRAKDKNEKLEVRWLSEEDESFTYIHNLVLARIIW